MSEIDIAAIAIAIITGAISLISLYFTNKHNQNLADSEKRSQEAIQRASENHDTEMEQLKSVLGLRKDEKDAIRNYEYQARERLYLEFEPLSFQLVELSELAMRRIRALAREAKEGHLELKGNLYTKKSQHMANAIYRLLVPLAAFRLMQRQLTFIDISLDHSVNLRYNLAKILYYSFTHDSRLAVKCPLTSNYSPMSGTEEQRRKYPAVYLKQGIYHQTLVDTMADELIYEKSSDKDKPWRIKTFHEFEESYRNLGQRIFDPLESLLEGFHPKNKPVLWLILLLQLHIYQALINFHKDKAKENNTDLRSDSPYTAISQKMFSIMDGHHEDIDWRQLSDKQTTDEEVWIEPLKAVKSYLQDNWTDLLQR